jgi:sigma-54 dependent transcriptional regulator, acetoin dehydrogenase operon transcriptional activator AcoR
MRSIGVITQKKSDLADFLKDNLKQIFSGYASVNNYYFNDLTPDTFILDDCVLVMSSEKAVKARRYVRDIKRIIVIQRTIREPEASKIAAIPANTKVLVVNNGVEMTFETIALLYQLGINHLDIVPFESDHDYHDIALAITPGESGLVPPYIPTVLDVGNRCIDLPTLFQIITRLGMDDWDVHQRLIQYSENILTLNFGLKKQHREIFQTNLELNTVINASGEGILLLSEDNQIILYNCCLADMLGIKREVFGGQACTVFPASIVSLLQGPDVNNQVIEINGKTLVVNKQEINCQGLSKRKYYNFHEVTQIRQLEQALSSKLREKGLVARYAFSDIKTHSARMAGCIKLAKKIALSDFTVLISGESGTGKELLAQSIHSASNRGHYPFVAVNCAAVPESLLESELFGYESGSFTGALKEGKIGLFEQANKGTIFLDEVGDMPLSLQARMLRVIQERQVTRIGSSKVINIDIRIIASTNKYLTDECRHGKFREDLYYRLNVLPLVIPPLRERCEDILLLLGYFLDNYRAKRVEISPEAQNTLLRYQWPGNVRELQNVAAYLALVIDGQVSIDTLPQYVLEKTEDFQAELLALSKRATIEELRAAFEALSQTTGIGRRMGRKHLAKLIGSRDRHISEGEARGILSAMKELNLIIQYTGRRGTEITQRGLAFSRWLKNQSSASEV